MASLINYQEDSQARDVLGLFASQLKKLRAIADVYASEVKSEGLRTLFETLKRELDDKYLASVEAHLKELRFPNGVLISADLGTGNGGINYILRKPNRERQGFIDFITGNRQLVYTFHIDASDVGGGRVLEEMRGKALNLVANALAQSADHLRSFFTMLRTELAFYVGCLNLHERLVGMGQRVCFPVPAPAGEREHSFAGLYDACLALTMGRGVVGNDLHADGKELAIITGANQGGKSTFLRSVCLAQLMMQCGLFVPAE